MIKHLIYLLCLCTLVAACTTSPTGRRQLMLISPESAIVESKKAYLGTVAELDQQKKLVTDPKVVKRVQNVTGRLVTEAVAMYPNSADWEWSVAIIDDPETINAWCMAGGRMAIYTGIINKLDLSDDEMAQIMGHEISHALANHTAERMSRAMAINLGVVAAGVAADNHAVALTGAALAAKLALELPNSRTAESEADRIGTELATRAGYKPEAAASLWRKMGEQSGGAGGPEFLSTHPAPGNREKTLTGLVPEMKALNPSGKKAAVYPITIVQ
ncbi:M48 family metallopeptidase [Simiduia litorea]|uniref:M48 family metallopeptidase n=1 Tax=Simiduia litorea TaxID=1435348 RepID=UPI0036F3D15D